MSNPLTLEKLKIDERLQTVEKTIGGLDASVQEIKNVLFGEKGESGVVTKLNSLISIAETVASTMAWIAKLVLGTVILAALPSVANFINMIMHTKP